MPEINSSTEGQIDGAQSLGRDTERQTDYLYYAY